MYLYACFTWVIFNYQLSIIDWFTLTETLEHVAKVAIIESKVKPQHESHLQFFGSENINQTLWEKEQFCVRFMVEEGRINLLLRMIKDWKTLNIDYAQQAMKLKMNPINLQNRMYSFEKFAGILLKCCYSSIESLQTLDFMELATHTANVLSRSNSNFIHQTQQSLNLPSQNQFNLDSNTNSNNTESNVINNNLSNIKDLDTFNPFNPSNFNLPDTSNTSTPSNSTNLKEDQLSSPKKENDSLIVFNDNRTDAEYMQEYMVFDYLRSVFENIDQLQEETIGRSLLNLKVLNLAIQFISNNEKNMSLSTKYNCALMISSFMDTEFYQSHRDEFLESDEDKRLLVALKNNFVMPLLVDYRRKKELRALFDNIMRLEITHPSENLNETQPNSKPKNESSSVNISNNPLGFLQSSNRTRRNIFGMINNIE